MGTVARIPPARQDPDACHGNPSTENHRFNGKALDGFLSASEAAGLSRPASRLLQAIVVAHGDDPAPLPYSWARSRTRHRRTSHFDALRELRAGELLDYVPGAYVVRLDRRGRPRPSRGAPIVRISARVRFAVTDGVEARSRAEIHRSAEAHRRRSTFAIAAAIASATPSGGSSVVNLPSSSRAAGGLTSASPVRIVPRTMTRAEQEARRATLRAQAAALLR